MKKTITMILGYIFGFIVAVIILPLGLIYFFASVFWKIFGMSIISFIILMLLGLSQEECFKYSAGLGFFIGVCLKYKEIKNG